jgi:LmbE family N-acetylglucosaminyl deacetylase
MVRNDPTFQGTDAPRRRVLVLSPHFDDAVFGCWSLLSAPDVDAHVANVFAGRPEPGRLSFIDRAAGVPDSAALVDARAAEDAVALAHADVESSELPIPEFRYRVRQTPIPRWMARVLGCPGRRTLTLPTSRDVPDLHEQLVDAFCALGDGQDELVAPAGIGGHPDHHLVRAAAHDASARLGARLSLYADLPYACVGGWPAWAVGEGAAPRIRTSITDEEIEREWSRTSAPWATQPTWSSARVVHLTADEVDAKRRSVAEYRTQLQALDALSGGRMFHDDTWSRELFWHVR